MKTYGVDGQSLTPEQEACFKVTAQVLSRYPCLPRDLGWITAHYGYAEKGGQATSSLFDNTKVAKIHERHGVEIVKVVEGRQRIYVDGNQANDPEYQERLNTLREQVREEAHQNAKRTAQRTKILKSLKLAFVQPQGLEKPVARGDYQVVSGDDSAVAFEPSRVSILRNDAQQHNIIRGATLRGWYEAESPDGEATPLPILSFLYHKLDPNTGALENAERVIISTGVGYGEHLGHIGQPPSWYIVGAHIGSFDSQTGQITDMPNDPRVVEPKHFSMDCVSGWSLSEPLLANPQLLEKTA